MKATHLLLSDSGAAWYAERDGRKSLMKVMKSFGMDNIHIEVMHGGTIKEYERMLTLWTDVHKEFLIGDGNGNPIFPPGFNVILLHNLCDLP